MQSVLRDFLVIAPLPVVVEDEQGAVNYNPGAVFRALDNGHSVLRLLALGSIIPILGTFPQPGSVVLGAGPAGPAGAAGATGPAGPPGPASTHWRPPVEVTLYYGNASVATINGIGAPVIGQAFVTLSSGTLTIGSLSVAIGDLVEFSGTAWVKVVSGVAGILVAGTRALIPTGVTLFAPLVTGVDDRKIAEWFGASNTPSLETPLDGWAALDHGTGSVFNNQGWAFDDATPPGVWSQFTGAGGIVYAVTGDIVSVTPGDTANAGILNTTARGDHRHAVPVALSGDIVAETPGATADAGTLSKVARGDHRHAMPAALVGDLISVTPGATADAGTLNVVARGDHRHAAPAALAGDIISVVPGDTADAGTLGAVARGDHRHAVPTAVPVAVGTANAAGSASSVSRSDHVHDSPSEALADKDLAPLATSGNQATTGIIITNTPALDSYVTVSVNGLAYPIGDASLLSACYFSITGGASARAITAITAGDTLYWNGLNAGFDLEVDDSVDLAYLAF